MSRRTTPRSFVLPPAAEALPDPEVKAADLPAPVDWARIFGRTGPLEVEIEVGFGKGRFLLERAAASPARLCFGIEHAPPYVRLVRHRALLRGLTNVRLLAGDARDFFARLAPPASLAAVFVLFPDPWPKKRHHKRRLLGPTFLDGVARALLPGAPLLIVTDDAGYAAAIGAAAAAVPALCADPSRIPADLEEKTHYAAKLAARGVPFHAFAWVRAA